jgi:hypothetical protein
MESWRYFDFLFDADLLSGGMIVPESAAIATRSCPSTQGLNHPCPSPTKGDSVRPVPWPGAMDRGGWP